MDNPGDTTTVVDFLKTISYVIAPLATVIAAWLGVRLSSERTRRLEFEKRVRVKQDDIYRQFMKFYTDISRGLKDPSMMKEALQNIEAQYLEFATAIVLYGSDKIVRKFIDMKDEGLQSLDPQGKLKLLSDLFLQMRKELGQEKTTLSRGEILATFVRDIEEMPNME